MKRSSFNEEDALLNIATTAVLSQAAITAFYTKVRPIDMQQVYTTGLFQLLLSINGAILENACSIPLLILILWLFNVFRSH